MKILIQSDVPERVYVRQTRVYRRGWRFGLVKDPGDATVFKNKYDAGFRVTLVSRVILREFKVVQVPSP